MKFAFFVVIGGISIQRSRLDDYVSRQDFDSHHWRLFDDTNVALRTNNQTLHLTASSVLDLAHFGHWIYIDPKQIRNRSKADGIKKSLVLLQVSWMLVSCISRKACGLPLTLLELHTMVHVACAVAMCILWSKVWRCASAVEFYSRCGC